MAESNNITENTVPDGTELFGHGTECDLAELSAPTGFSIGNHELRVDSVVDQIKSARIATGAANAIFWTAA